MPYPSAPEIQTSYTAEEQALGNGTLPGQELDVDLASIRASVTAIIEFLKTSLRSDGRLANGSVTQDALASSILIGFDPPAPWATGVAYTTRSTVFEGFGFYLCTVAHTSGTFATDLASGRWVLLADLTPPGGALIASNNLSDVADVGNTRANLGLGSLATASAGTGPTQYRTNAQQDAAFQPLAANLTALGGLASAADKLGYFTGSGTAALTDLTAAGRALLDDATAEAQRTTLGLEWTLVDSGTLVGGTTVTGLGGYRRVRVAYFNAAPTTSAAISLRVGSAASGILSSSIYYGTTSTAVTAAQLETNSTTAKNGVATIERFNTTDSFKFFNSVISSLFPTAIQSSEVFDRIRINALNAGTEIAFASGTYYVWGAN